MAPFLPALLLVVFAAWAGTLFGDAGFGGRVTGHLALLAVVAWGAHQWRDPLHLGSRGRLLPVVSYALLAAGVVTSEVSRAGLQAVLLVPAFGFLPAVVERCWADAGQRRVGLRAVAAGAGAIALWALLDWLVFDLRQASMPMGHHHLLAVWLVLLFPLAAEPRREEGVWRWLGRGCGLLVAVAILASRSVVGVAALGAQLLVLSVGWRQRSAALLMVLLGGVVHAPRLSALASGGDPSLLARRVYWQAGWSGIQAKPWLGWGAGSTPWTVARFLSPRPGVNPPGEVVGDLHSLPLQLTYELGLLGFVLVAVCGAWFILGRVRELRHRGATSTLRCGVASLIGGAVCTVAGGTQGTTAVWVAAAVAAGLLLAATPRPRERGSLAAPTAVYAAIAALLLWPLDRALQHYERARLASAPGIALAEIERAVGLDPGFPLYRARKAWLETGEGRGGAAAREAVAAAEAARSVAVLWLAAGEAGLDAGSPWAWEALQHACSLDPLGALAPFHLARATPDQGEAARLGARALLAEPRLAAAVLWQTRPELLRRALRLLRAWPGVDAGWREEMARLAARGPAATEAVSWLALEMDREPALSVSLHLFRRLPWPAELAPVAVSSRAALELRIPAAVELATTRAEALPRRCGAPPGAAGEE